MRGSSMKSRKGFTLFELLVTVLIIGILAAIALPQYQKVVTKSRAAQLRDAVSAMARASDRFFIMSGYRSTSFEQLDIDYDLQEEESSICGSSVSDGAVRRNNDYEFLIGSLGDGYNQVSARFASGPYKCTGFSVYFAYQDYPELENKLLCYERPAGHYSRGSKNEKGDFCEKVMGYTDYVYVDVGNAYFYY